MIRSRPVNARASRTAVIVASVPELTNRTISTEGTARRDHFAPIRFRAAKSSRSSFRVAPDPPPPPPRPDARGPESARPTSTRNRDTRGRRRRKAACPARDRSPAACRPPRETRAPGYSRRPPRIFAPRSKDLRRSRTRFAIHCFASVAFCQCARHMFRASIPLRSQLTAFNHRATSLA